jgi:hypothetical protein
VPAAQLTAGRSGEKISSASAHPALADTWSGTPPSRGDIRIQPAVAGEESATRRMLG